MSRTVRVVHSHVLGQLTDIERQLPRHPEIAFSEAPLSDAATLRQHAAEAQVLLIGPTEPLNSEVLTELTALALIVRRGAGLDNVDVQMATKLGIAVAYVPDATVEEVSDHALTLLLATERQVVRVDRAVRDGQGLSARELVDSARRFNDLTLGVIGLGRIGSRLAEKAIPLFGKVLGYDSAFPLIRGVEQVSLSDLTARSHAISVHVPSSPGTQGMIDEGFLAGCQSGTILVNTSRGDVIDEMALLRALQTGHIAGAGLDVTATDPPEPSDFLLGVGNVVVTGHTAARGVRGFTELRARSVAAILAAVEGRPPEHLANPDVWPRAALRLRT